IYSSASVANTSPDWDGDGVPNIVDIDDDNDGILDVDEGIVDNNQDGVPDNSSVDTDGDGVPDGLDHDSDNDGIPDLRESNSNLALVAGVTHPNGVIVNTASFGSNGLYDLLETSPDSNILSFAIVDTDNDGVQDFRDIDSDNDGISDLVEAGGIDNNNDGRIDNFSDPDGKGIHEALRGNNLPIFDTDGDGVDDYRDTDSDNDTLPDSLEAGPMPNQPTDTDGDGAADYRETDSDGDGVADGQQHNGGSNPASGGPDWDGDGVPNIIDIDDDNDGILDVDEGIVDNNQDGVPDNSSVDTDGDGVPDGLDHDSDNDGIPDLRESNNNFALVAGVAHPNGVIVNTASFGSNGLYDLLETSPDSNILSFAIVDTDNDGVQDFRDIDSDNDGISDLVEAGGIDNNNDGRIDNFSDPDGKGIHEALRGNNLPIFDTDGDGVDDYRDTDSDNDTIPDSVEAGPMPNQPTDTDGDGAADYRETDSDGDAIPDNLEQLADPSVQNTSLESIETGFAGTGNGCSVSPIKAARSVDPLFLLMMAVSSSWMAMRRKKPTAANRIS
ncbi:hypothetical protein N9850_11950, partial [Granulosicoccus sp.]|nr:hypothetical protein [Granulosicoccus sp.]